MIGQPEIRTPTRGVYADLKRDLSIADLKANAAVSGAVKPANVPIRSKPNGAQQAQEEPPLPRVPTTQTALLLYHPRTQYALTPKHQTPRLRFADEVLIKVHAIGLNPIDWKAP